MVSSKHSPILVPGLLLLTLLGLPGCPKEDPAPLECGDVRTPDASSQSNIINGELTWDPEVVPLTDGQALAVSAVLTDDGFGNWMPICTATIVSPTLVLTAAHCVVDRRGNAQPVDAFAIGLGRDMLRPSSVLRPDQVAVDPYYNPRSSGAGHDEALFVFSEPITDTVPEVTPIPFNREIMEAAVVGEKAQAVGFGCVDSNCDIVNTEKFWAVEQLVELTDFDLSADGQGVTGVCFGDSGGPLLRNFPGKGIRVIGTLSWGSADCGNVDHYCLPNNEGHFLDLYAPGCGETTVEGLCVGNQATYCENDEPVTLDCEALGLACLADTDGLHRCVDPCAGETLEGRCDGDDLIWCESGSVKVRRCAECELSCGFSDSQQVNDCLPTPRT